MIHDLQKASLMKRFSAFLLDFVVMLMLFVGIMLIVSPITNFDSYLDKVDVRLTEIKEKHNISALEEESGILFSDFQYKTEEEKAQMPEEITKAYNDCTMEINKDNEIMKLFETILSLAIVIVSISMLITFIIIHFIVPLLFKNGQTLGKKIFGIAVMRTDGIKITPFVLFVRAILGKYTIGTMLPIIMLLMLLFGPNPLIPLMVIAAILLIQVVLLFTSKTRSLIHDHLASTVVVDMQSQMIFDSVEAKQEYQQRLHDEANDKATY